MVTTDMHLNLSSLLHTCSEDPPSSRSGAASISETSESGLTEINQVLQNLQSKHVTVNNDQLRLRPESWNVAELEVQRQRMAMQNALALEKHRHEKEISEMKMEYEKRFQRNLKATEEMNTVKEHLRDLSLSDAQYAECKRLPDEELSVREFVLIRVYELRDGFKKQLEQLQLAQDALRAECSEARHEQERLSVHAEHKSSCLSRIQEDFRLLKDESDRRIEHLTQEAKKREEEARTFCDKAGKYDEMCAEVERLRATVASLQTLTKDQSTNIMQLSKEKIDLTERVSDLGTRKELLEKDVMDNLRQLQINEELCAKRVKEIEQLELKLGRTKEKKRALQMKMELDQSTAACEVRERVNVEIQRLEGQMTRDIDLQKQNLIALHDKEKQMMSQQVLDLERQRSELQRRWEECENAREDVRQSGHKIQMELQNEITELRGLLKLRGFENDRYSMSYEETSGTLAKVTQEKEELQAKVDLLRKEYYELEVRLKEEGAQDRATKLALQEQLESYHEMERELDNALQDVVNHDDTEQPRPESVTEALIVGTTLAGAPACTRRRIQESLILAQQLQRKTRAVNAAQRSIEELEERNRVLDEEKDLLQKEIQWQKEPTHYLTESLRVRECELADMRRAHKVLQREFEAAQNQCRELHKARQEAEADVKALLSQREKVSARNAEAAAVAAQSASGASLAATGKMKSDESLKATEKLYHTSMASKKSHAKRIPEWAQKLTKIREGHALKSA